VAVSLRRSWRCQPRFPVLRCSAPGKGLFRLSSATDAFYAARYSEAARGYAALIGAPDAGVAETARYMVGRAELGEALGAHRRRVADCWVA